MAKRRRHRRNDEWAGAFVGLGAAVGIWITANHQAHSRAKPHVCPKGLQVGNCVGNALGHAVAPYVVGGAVGAFAGLLVAGLVVLSLRVLRPRGGVGKASMRPTVTRAPAPVTPPKSIQGAPAALTKAELHQLRLKVRKSVLGGLREMKHGGERSDILSRARSTGGFTPRELTAPVARRQPRKHDLQIDHDLDWALTDLKRDGLATNPSRGIWRPTDAALVEAESPLAAEVLPQRLDELRTMPYDEYLRTPEWRQIRAAALVRADHQCALDPEHVGPLEVHHRFYERRGAELPSDLIVLCGACHKRHHRY